MSLPRTFPNFAISVCIHYSMQYAVHTTVCTVGESAVSVEYSTLGSTLSSSRLFRKIVFYDKSFREGTFQQSCSYREQKIYEPLIILQSIIMAQLSDIPESNWKNVFVNEPAVNDIVKQIIYKASTIQGDNRVAWLLRVITCIDLTTLGGDDTETNVETLCERAVKPMDVNFEWPEPLHTAAVCVYPAKAKIAIGALKNLEVHLADKNDRVRVASVAAGFPTGQYPLASRLTEIEYAVTWGVDEIDIVIDRSLALAHKWDDLYAELRTMRKVCGEACMKTILAVGELPSLADVYIASMVAMHAGSDFIKTSTGKETVNATLPVGIVMCRAIRDFYRQTERRVGFKPAGGIKTSVEALQWLVLVKEELGNAWLNKDLFRIGASSLLDDIVKSIE